MDSKQQLSYPKLKGSVNYDSWAENTIVTLTGLGLWGYPSGLKTRPLTLPPSTKLLTLDELIELWDQQDAKAMTFIRLTCAEDIQSSNLKGLRTSSSMWNALKVYANTGLAYLYSAEQSLHELNIHNVKGIDEYCQRFKQYRRELNEQLDSPLPAKLEIAMFLRGLNPSGSTQYESFVSRKRSEIGPTFPTLDALISDATEEGRMHELNNSRDITAYNTQVKKGGRNMLNCTNCKRTNTNHTSGTCWRDIVCTKCHKKGHPTERCRASSSSASSHLAWPVNEPPNEEEDDDSDGVLVA